MSSTGWRAIASEHHSGDAMAPKRNELQWPSSSSHFLRVRKAGRGTIGTHPPMHVMLRHPLIHINTIASTRNPIFAHIRHCVHDGNERRADRSKNVRSTARHHRRRLFRQYSSGGSPKCPTPQPSAATPKFRTIR
jgi:hypothetical protein